jgi:hypothetical protein
VRNRSAATSISCDRVHSRCPPNDVRGTVMIID